MVHSKRADITLPLLIKCIYSFGDKGQQKSVVVIYKLKNATLYIIICTNYASMEPVGEKDYEEYIIKLAPATHAALI